LVMKIAKMCNLRDIKSKVKRAPNLEILRQYTLMYLDKCVVGGEDGEAKAKETKKNEPRKKRKPSAYNLFMKECIPQKKQDNPGVEHTEVFSLCAGDYKQRKENGEI